MHDKSGLRKALLGISFVGFASIALVGCSSRPRNVARRVTGTVTLGGQPLPKASVTFTPTAEKGSPSFGVTDDAGKYTLIWGRSGRTKIEGAQMGENLVTISTLVEGDSSPGSTGAGSPEKVPYKYRQEGGFPKVTVNRGSNTIDIALDAGPVEPPKPKPKTKGRR